MCPRQIEIREILIQGNKGKTAGVQDTISGIVKINDPTAMDINILKDLFKSEQFFIYHNNLLYHFSPTPPFLSLIKSTVKNQTAITDLMSIFNSMGATAKIRFADAAIIKLYEALIPQDHVKQAVQLIESIALHTNSHHVGEDITRAITDEFSFYLKDRPFSLDEYKQIIAKTCMIAQSLSPDVHLVLSTFAVLWPGGGIHNCGLYVQSPKNKEDKPTIHHFSKKNISNSDINYDNADGLKYELTTDDECSDEHLPNTILKDTGVCINDFNQYESALKISTSDGRELLVSIGICLDHAEGVERTQVHGLISSLQKNNQSVPLHCSHVITSASVGEKKQHVLSTLSHSDPGIKYRRPLEFPNRSTFMPSSITSAFSGTLNTEIYPPKPIGTVHSDLFQHIVANKSESELVLDINQQNNEGNTMLHQVFFETDFDRELIAKRLYSLILNGGDPNIKNKQGQSARDLAIEKEMTEPNKIISKAFDAAPKWRNSIKGQNTNSSTDNRTPLTRKAITFDRQGVQELIVSGANPYTKDGCNQSLMDIIRTKYPQETQYSFRKIVFDLLRSTQYGFGTSIAPDDKESWFYPPPPQAQTKLEILLQNPVDTVSIIREVASNIPNLDALPDSPANSPEAHDGVEHSAQEATSPNEEEVPLDVPVSRSGAYKPYAAMRKVIEELKKSPHYKRNEGTKEDRSGPK